MYFIKIKTAVKEIYRLGENIYTKYLTKNLYLNYIKNSYNLIIRQRWKSSIQSATQN